MKKALIGAAITAAFALAGEMGFQDAQDEKQRYCEMVESGNWPDFDPQRNCDTE